MAELFVKRMRAAEMVYEYKKEFGLPILDQKREDKELFDIFENKDIDENIDEIIIRSLNIKKSVVEQDEKESGLRKILNFGHTIGHGIESSEEMSELYHGECVALLEQMNLFIDKFNSLKTMLETEDIDGMRDMMRHSTQRRALFDKK